ncbi:hypothetical protein [Alkaliphilus serpentinus]|uniref:Uncharacterized protein n=1 Tax=Alkaliphilus serpentinus TaxID=1482731 RepID=A0A833MEL2_9FIRM|nr:hypothetical protein [Alkaliphilus serpentinus]KAB3531459.1 hypothetical protein F8153_04580 [Alkaliphilus serpentinus]
MKIEGIESIENGHNQLEVFLKVTPEERIASRWELVNPMVQATYSTSGQKQLEAVQLLDEGMAVHGYEFTKEEEKMIKEYINKEFNKI